MSIRMDQDNMMTTLEEYGVKSNLEVEDYLEGLENLRKIW